MLLNNGGVQFVNLRCISTTGAAAVGSVFGWHYWLGMTCAFGRIPGSVANWFFRFSWRNREPYGCTGLPFDAGGASLGAIRESRI